MNKDNTNDYPIVVTSGLLHGSVCIQGSLPPTLSAGQALRLERAIKVVRKSGEAGDKATIAFTISQPKNAGAWNV